MEPYRHDSYARRNYDDLQRCHESDATPVSQAGDSSLLAVVRGILHIMLVLSIVWAVIQPAAAGIAARIASRRI